MIYDPNSLTIKKLIDSQLPEWKEEFLQNTLDLSSAPMYDIGENLDIHKKWKMIIVKIMDEWNEENILLYPKFAKFIEFLGKGCRSAGFSILEPGGYVVPHVDTEEDQDQYIIVHAPLIVPKGDIGFTEGNAKGKWVEGDTFILDVETEHSIWNYTNEHRVVILLELSKKEFL